MVHLKFISQKIFTGNFAKASYGTLISYRYLFVLIRDSYTNGPLMIDPELFIWAQKDSSIINLGKKRVRDVYLGSDLFHPGSRDAKIPDPDPH